MKFDIKKLLVNILIPVILGGVVGYFSGAYKGFSNINMPSFAPPSILFPIVWTIIYTLMGISCYIVEISYDTYRDKALFSYYLQLLVNLLWSFIFFTFKLYFLSFLWILLLIVLVIIMIRRFYALSKISGLIQIPYLIWITFAAILNFSIYLLN